MVHVGLICSFTRRSILVLCSFLHLCEFVTSRIFVCISGRIRHRAMVTRKRETVCHVVWKNLVSTHTKIRAKSWMNYLLFSTYFNCCVNMCIYNTVILIIPHATVSIGWTVFSFCCFYPFVFGSWTVVDELSSIFWYRTIVDSGCVNSWQSIIICFESGVAHLAYTIVLFLKQLFSITKKC